MPGRDASSSFSSSSARSRVGIGLGVTVGVAVLLAATLGAPPVGAADLTARFLGQGGVELSDGERTIVVDFPYLPGASGAPARDPLATRVRPGSLCLFTHSHPDHFDPELVAAAPCTVAGPKDVVAALPADRVRPIDGASTWEGIGIVPVPSPHAGLEHFSYRLEWQGFTIYLSGDTDSTAELLAQRRIDVAFVAPWLLTSPRTVRRLDAARIVVVHHDEHTTASGCERCFVPEPGQILRLRAGR